MKKIVMCSLIAVIALIATQCKKEDELKNKGSGSFVLGVKQTTLKATVNPKVHALLVSVVDDKGVKIWENKEIILLNMGGVYISSSIDMPSGSYQITSFMVIDSNRNVLYLTPLEGSAKASIVNDPLPIHFSITEGKITQINPEVVVPEPGVPPSDYGYAQFMFTVVDEAVDSDSICIRIGSSDSIVLSKYFVKIIVDSVNIKQIDYVGGVISLCIKKPKTSCFIIHGILNSWCNKSIDVNISEIGKYSCSGSEYIDLEIATITPCISIDPPGWQTNYQPICNLNATVKSAGSVLDKSQEDYYYQIWKNILMTKNDMSQAYFDEHIIQTAVSTTRWSQGISFRIDYLVKFDWAISHSQDEFIVNYNPVLVNGVYTGKYLDETELEAKIDGGTNNEISTILDIKIPYQNCEELLNELVAKTGFNGIELNGPVYWIPGIYPRENGYPYARISGHSDNIPNNCLSGYVNLVTGEYKVFENACNNTF